MTCAEFKELLAAYALGALTAPEVAAVEAHLAADHAHDGCLEALRQANDTVALLGVSLPPIAPPPSLWKSIERHIEASARPSVRRRSWARARAWAWPASALVAAAAVVLLIFMFRDRALLQEALDAAHQQADQRVAAAEERAATGERERARCVADLDKLRTGARLREEAVALLGTPGARLVALNARGGTHATAQVILHAAQSRAILVGTGLRAPTGHDYELWIIRGKQKIAAGLLHSDETGQLITAVDPALLAAGPVDALAVTLEARGGGPAPLGPIVLVGGI